MSQLPAFTRERTEKDFFDAFSEPIRFQLFRFLAARTTGLPLQGIADNFAIRPSVCSHHLSILNRIGLVDKQTIHRNAWYKANMEVYSEFCVLLFRLIPDPQTKESSNDPHSRPETTGT